MTNWLTRAILLTFVTVVPIQAIRPMVSYRALELGADAFGLGVIAGAYASLSFLLSVLLGRWTDRFGSTWFLIGSPALIGATAIWFSIAGSLPMLVVAQAMLGLGQVTGLIAMQTLLSNHGDPMRRDGRIGAFTVAGAAAQMIGPAAAGYVFTLTDGSLPLVFLLTATLCVAGVGLATTFLFRPAPVSSDVRSGAPQGSMRSDVGTILRTPSVPHAMLASLTVLTTIDLMIAYLPAYGEARGISVGVVSLLISVQAAGTILSRLLMVRLLRRFGRRNLLVGSMVLPCAALLLLPLTSLAPLLFVIVLVAGFGLGLGQPLSLAWIVAQVPDTMRGTAIGVRLTANRLGQLALPIGVGALAGATGVGAIFVTAGTLLGVSAGAVARAPMRTEPR